MPDLFLALPKSEFGGVWIEMKAPTGKPSVVQRKWMKRLTTVGYRVIISNSSMMLKA
ncbi:VRR-NUC domain-containing protein [Serratia proteamaculans]|uniref:VRR-NUC domain-containing protein n=1 Tax=Serratia proteamaculans TaxID=28151 RepID=UPI0039BDF3F1